MKKIVSITIVLIISISMIFAAEIFDDFKADEEIDTVNPGKQGQQVKMKMPIKCEENWIIRRKK